MCLVKRLLMMSLTCLCEPGSSRFYPFSVTTSAQRFDSVRMRAKGLKTLANKTVIYIVKKGTLVHFNNQLELKTTLISNRNICIQARIWSKSQK